MDTKEWGPRLWYCMFTVAANYPIEIDQKNKLHACKLRKHRIFFENFQYILPCKYCRRSYKQFLKELPIKNYLKSRNTLMYWVYLIKDKVNKKLIKQEKKNGGTFKTKESPPFEEVCKFYEKIRAKCSDKTKTCRKPLDIQ
jgi:hypothetical protein